MFNDRRFVACFALLIIVHVILLAWGAYCHSPTSDELAHLTAGVSHWQLGHFDINRANPPLVGMVAAIPVILADPEVDWSRSRSTPFERLAWAVGNDFARANGDRIFWLVTLGRWACIPFSILGALVCGKFAFELFGKHAAILASALWCFSPNILAHAQLITADVPAFSCGIASCYTFRCWLKNSKWELAFFAGIVLGIAELTKFTWVILFPLWPSVWVATRLYGTTRKKEQVTGEMSQLLLILVIGLWILNTGYAFENSFKRLGEFQFISRTLAGAGDRPGNRFAGHWIAQLPLPVPESYVSGIDVQKLDFEIQKWSYLSGRWRRGGWWYYYLYGLAVKVPLGTWLMTTMAIALAIRRREYSCQFSDELLLIAPLLIVVVLVSSQTGMNSHVRYVMPVLPFVYISVSRVAKALDRRHFRTFAIVAAAAIWSTLSSLRVYPHSLAYFNELAGGPLNGHRHLINSNLDWGQDLLFLKDLLEQRSEIEDLRLVYYGPLSPTVAGIDFVLPKRIETIYGNSIDPSPGWYAVSVNALYGHSFFAYGGTESGDYWNGHSDSWLLRLAPTAIAGRTIYLYHVDTRTAKAMKLLLGIETSTH